MTNQEKIAYLKQYGYALRKENRLREEIAMWRSRAEKVTPSMSGMPGGGGDGSAPFVNAVDQICKLEAMLCAQMMAMAQLREDIEQAVEAVRDDRLREVLELYYIRNLTWEQVADTLHYGCRHVYKLHAQALSDIMA